MNKDEIIERQENQINRIWRIMEQQHEIIERQEKIIQSLR